MNPYEIDYTEIRKFIWEDMFRLIKSLHTEGKFIELETWKNFWLRFKLEGEDLIIEQQSMKNLKHLKRIRKKVYHAGLGEWWYRNIRREITKVRLKDEHPRSNTES